MNQGKYVFAQIMEHMPLSTFRRCVDRYGGQHKVKRFSCRDQFLCMAFAQLTYRESLRDIEACLRAAGRQALSPGFPRQRRPQHPGQRQRDARLAHLRRFRPATDRHRSASCMPTNRFGVELEKTVYALDSTTIDLCLSLFPWAKFRSDQGGGQAAHAAGSARQHPTFDPHYRRQAARRQHPRSAGPRGRRLLHHRPRLHRFCALARLHSSRQPSL